MTQSVWPVIPPAGDLRWRVLVLFIVFLAIGVQFLGINKSLPQIVFMVAFACLYDMALHWILRDRARLLFPLSAAITGFGLSILTNYAHSIVLAVIPQYFAMSSKYILTAQGRHVFNPGLCGLVLCLIFSSGLVSPASASQWGGQTGLIFFFVLTALSLFVFNLRRSVLTLSFLGLYAVQLLLRAYWLEPEIPADLLISGILVSPAFYLFTYFMLTDPATSPADRKGQFIMALTVVAFDLVFHLLQWRFTLFYAGFAYFALRWAWLQWQLGTGIWSRVCGKLKDMAVIGCIGLVGGWVLIHHTQPAAEDPHVGLTLQEIKGDEAGIQARPGTLLAEVDPRIRHVVKWFFSFGEAVAIRDVDGNGLLDMFVTMPLKNTEDRAQLYLNQGAFHFKRFEIPALDALRHHPETFGVPMNALWFDSDNDGDQDLLIVVYGGHPVLLRNQLAQTGNLGFEDVSESVGLVDYMNSAAVNVLDVNRDGRLDIYIGGTLSATHTAYDDGRKLNLFALPDAVDKEDRRPIKVMRQNPFDSKNGGENALYIAGEKGMFHRQSNAALGIDDPHRWTLAIGTGDVNGDGWTDLYVSNTAGPDNLLVNIGGKAFAEVRGTQKNHVGQDTYRGMNASFADFDNNGTQDIYVSNMHKPEAPEGSMLWLNDGSFGWNQASSLRDTAFENGISNHGRFGWGAAVGDINRDGLLDIVQMNGWLDDGYDKRFSTCPDYTYKMFQVEATPARTHAYADNWPDMEGTCMYPREAKRLYLNRGEGRFIDAAEHVGWGVPDNAKAVALADFDNDGALDVVVTRMTDNLSIYRQRPSHTPYWFGLELEGDGATCNRDANGTRVVVRYHTRDGVEHQQERYITASNGLSAESDPRMLFGFGEEMPKEVLATVYWCGNTHGNTITPTLMRYQKLDQSR